MTVPSWRWTIAVILAINAGASTPCRGLSNIDQPAALLVFPYVVVDSHAGTDTFLQLGNTSTLPVLVRCFYENNNRRCSNDVSRVCAGGTECGPGGCIPGWSETDFAFRIGASTFARSGAPLGWRLSQGLPVVPRGGSIPPAPEDPFLGVVRCLVAGEDGGAVADNALIGTATVETFHPDSPARFDVAKYNAIGFSASADPNPGTVLGLGGVGEYDSCPNAFIVPHTFDGATDVVTAASTIETTLVLVPCSVDYTLGIPGHAAVSYVVFDEFDGRVASAADFELTGQRMSTLSDIDPKAFKAANRGSLSGSTLLHATADMAPPLDGGSGILVVAIETHRNLSQSVRSASAVRQPYGRGARVFADTIILPPLSPPPPAVMDAAPTPRADAEQTPRTARPTVPSSLHNTPTGSSATSPIANATQAPDTASSDACPGDCNGDRTVTVDELLLMVNVALGAAEVSQCVGGDANHDGAISVAEIVAAARRATAGCDAP